MFTIIKQFSFSASHQLLGLPEDHPCSRLHGHNYLVEVELQSEQLNDVGFVRDYRELDKFKRYIDDTLDHRHLNEVFACNPTAELLAITLFAAAKQFASEVVAVRVSETPKTWAEYRPAKSTVGTLLTTPERGNEMLSHDNMPQTLFGLPVQAVAMPEYEPPVFGHPFRTSVPAPVIEEMTSDNCVDNYVREGLENAFGKSHNDL